MLAFLVVWSSSLVILLVFLLVGALLVAVVVGPVVLGLVLHALLVSQGVWSNPVLTVALVVVVVGTVFPWQRLLAGSRIPP